MLEEWERSSLSPWSWGALSSHLRWMDMVIIFALVDFLMANMASLLGLIKTLILALASALISYEERYIEFNRRLPNKVWLQHRLKHKIFLIKILSSLSKQGKRLEFLHPIVIVDIARR